MSSARTVTSISPETPVSSWSAFTSSQRLQVLRHELAHVGDHLALGVEREPHQRHREPDASTRRGRARATPSVRQERSASHSRASGGARAVRAQPAAARAGARARAAARGRRSA